MKPMIAMTDVDLPSGSPERKLLCAIVLTAIEDVKLPRRDRETSKSGTYSNERAIRDGFRVLVSDMHDPESVFGYVAPPQDTVISVLSGMISTGKIKWVPPEYKWIGKSYRLTQADMEEIADIINTGSKKNDKNAIVIPTKHSV